MLKASHSLDMYANQKHLGSVGRAEQGTGNRAELDLEAALCILYDSPSNKQYQKVEAMHQEVPIPAPL